MKTWLLHLYKPHKIVIFWNIQGTISFHKTSGEVGVIKKLVWLEG